MEVPVHSSHTEKDQIVPQSSLKFQLKIRAAVRWCDIMGLESIKTQWMHHEITRKGAKMSRIYVRDNVIGSPHCKTHSSRKHRKVFPWRFGWQRKVLFCEQINMCDKKEIALKDVYIVWLYTIFKLRNSCKLQWVSKWCKQLTH